MYRWSLEIKDGGISLTIQGNIVTYLKAPDSVSELSDVFGRCNLTASIDVGDTKTGVARFSVTAAATADQAVDLLPLIHAWYRTQAANAPREEAA